MGSLPPFYRNPPTPHHANQYAYSAPPAPQRPGPGSTSFLPTETNSHGSRLPREDSGMGSMSDPSFDILDWHPKYLSCQRYFLDHAQHEAATQAVCALINIRLPFQWAVNPVCRSSAAQQQQSARSANSNFNFNAFARAANSPYEARNSHEQANFASLIPYVRRLVVTGFDKPGILHGFFGDDYVKGIMPQVECERRNYLFAAKAGGWRSCKKQYDVGSGGGGDETVPFMKPLQDARMEELTAAEREWSAWLAMEDWMVGPRAPEDEDAVLSGRGGSRAGGAGARENMTDGVPNDLHDSRSPDGRRS